MTIYARPNVSSETAPWATQIQQSAVNAEAAIARLQQDVNLLNRQQGQGGNALGAATLSVTAPAIFAASDTAGFLVNQLTSSPTEYTNISVPVPDGYDRALINMTGSVSAINTGTAMTVNIICDPFYSIDLSGDPASNVYIPHQGLCATPLNGAGTAVSATGADVDVTGATVIYVGILSYITAGASPVNLSNAQCRISGSISFYKS
jgi:hypothetical protein